MAHFYGYVSFLARPLPLDLAVLDLRYQTELRWQLARPEREDLTMNLWLAMQFFSLDQYHFRQLFVLIPAFDNVLKMIERGF